GRQRAGEYDLVTAPALERRDTGWRIDRIVEGRVRPSSKMKQRLGPGADIFALCNPRIGAFVGQTFELKRLQRNTLTELPEKIAERPAGAEHERHTEARPCRERPLVIGSVHDVDGTILNPSTDDAIEAEPVSQPSPS